jgi:ubiquinone/menaquinone biosynthesis C-methylase UbiE
MNKEVIDKSAIAIKAYDNVVDEYIEYYKTKDLSGGVPFQKEIDYVVSNLEDNSKILDMGTAIGDYARFLTEKCDKNFNVIGIDSSNNMLDKARINAPKAEFKLMDIRKLEFEPNTFDAVICFAILTYVDDNDCIKVLDRVDEILKSGGLLAINVLEHKVGFEKELIIPEPFNPKFNNYFNRYKKDFFYNYFSNKNYDILIEFDNPIFNSEEAGVFSEENQFSIILRKN